MELIYEGKMVENFPQADKIHQSRPDKPSKSQSGQEREREKKRIIIINLKNLTDKEKFLKAAREKERGKGQINLKGVALRLTTYLSRLSVETRS